MSLDDVIQIVKAEPDSHFLLLNCPECEGDNVAYVQKAGGSGQLWHGRCFDCGFEGQGAAVRHGAQILWNKGSREVCHGKVYVQSS